MQSKTEALRKKKTPDEQLGFSVLAPNLAHHLTSLLWGKNIGHSL